jgi:hypothetical protein
VSEYARPARHKLKGNKLLDEARALRVKKVGELMVEGKIVSLRAVVDDLRAEIEGWEPGGAGRAAVRACIARVEDRLRRMIG